MNLLDLVVKITCDDQASGEVAGIGSKITSMLGTAAKVGGAAVAVLGTATIALGKTALDAYANYEQLVGGIDTLFKDSSGKMQQYASDAYKTAGVSANRYMEISTSFAASLISSLGGDTAAAADMANMAIQDMSDNANKMGTSLEVVQEAYQSLARGNYEMLDSLKLGYGGTKTELERLLSDAEELAAAQGEVRDFSVDSYSDIVEAIHLVQNEMGITGTTALEAATTISGSIDSAKAAWDNWFAGLGNEDADMSALTDQLVESIMTAAGNIAPRVGEIATTFGQTIASKAPEIAQKFGSALMSALPPEVSGALSSAFSGLSEVFAYIADAVESYLLPAVQPMIEGFSQLWDSLQPVVSFLLAGFQQLLAIFGAGLVEWIAIFATGLGQIASGASVVVGWLVQFATWLTTIPGNISNFVTMAIGFFSQLPTNIANFLTMVITNIIAWVSQMGANALSAGSQFLSNIVSFISQVPGQIAGFLSSVIGNVASFVSSMASNAISAASQFASNLISGLASIPGQVVSIGADIVNGMVEGVAGAAQGLIDAVGGAVNNAIGFAKGLLGIASPSKVFREFGQFTMQGMALGIDDDSDLPAQSVDDAMRRMEAVPIFSPSAPGRSSRYTVDDLVEAIDSLHDDLGSIISKYAPTATPREFRNAVRSVVA